MPKTANDFHDGNGGRQAKVGSDRSPVYFMAQALRRAQKAAAKDETPIGAVLVKDGRIVASGYNLRESRQDVTLHAELTAIRKACRKLGSWRLDGCDLYVTLEPCVMCAGAIQQARIRTVYFGAYDPKAGGVVSKTQVLDLPLNHRVRYEGGILEDECSALLKSFFASMRRKDKETGLSKGQRRRRNQTERHAGGPAVESTPSRNV